LFAFIDSYHHKDSNFHHRMKDNLVSFNFVVIPFYFSFVIMLPSVIFSDNLLYYFVCR
jgi:hypothetical protein